jgi:hypothetical protein
MGEMRGGRLTCKKPLLTSEEVFQFVPLPKSFVIPPIEPGRSDEKLEEL